MGVGPHPPAQVPDSGDLSSALDALSAARAAASAEVRLYVPSPVAGHRVVAVGLPVEEARRAVEAEVARLRAARSRRPASSPSRTSRTAPGA